MMTAPPPEVVRVRRPNPVKSALWTVLCCSHLSSLPLPELGLMFWLGLVRTRTSGQPRPSEGVKGVSTACGTREPDSAVGPFCACYPSGSLSPPGTFLGVRGWPCPSVIFYSCGTHLTGIENITSSFVIFFLKGSPMGKGPSLR